MHSIGKKVCTGKCEHNYSQEVKNLAERFCEILNPKLKEQFPESFHGVDRQKELDSFHIDIENLDWLNQIGLHISTDKIDYHMIDELQKDAQIFKREENYQKAIGKYIEILKLDHIGGHYFDWNLKYIGGLFMQLERYTQTIEVYKEYLEFYPDDNDILNLLTDLYKAIETKKDFSAVRGKRVIKEKDKFISIAF